MPRFHDLLFAKIDQAATGEVIAAPTADSVRPGFIYVVNYVIDAAGAVTVQFTSTVGGNLTGAMTCATGTGIAASGGDMNTPVLRSGAGGNIGLTLGAAVQVSGHIAYYIDYR